MGTGNLDLYDARDLVKFGFPLAFTARHIKAMKQLDHKQSDKIEMTE